jgi:hypothetical protein
MFRKKKKDELISAFEASDLAKSIREKEARYREKEMDIAEKISYRANLGVKNCLYSVILGEEENIMKLCTKKGYRVKLLSINSKYAKLEIMW